MSTGLEVIKTILFVQFVSQSYLFLNQMSQQKIKYPLQTIHLCKHVLITLFIFHPFHILMNSIHSHTFSSLPNYKWYQAWKLVTWAVHELVYQVGTLNRGPCTYICIQLSDNVIYSKNLFSRLDPPLLVSVQKILFSVDFFELLKGVEVDHKTYWAYWGLI